jgi:signal transduction histidine kinase
MSAQSIVQRAGRHEHRPGEPGLPSASSPWPQAYLGLLTLVALGALALSPWLVIPTEAAYLPLAAAIAVGALLTIRLQPGASGATLIVLPAIVAFARFGSAALPALALASALGGLVHRLSWKHTMLMVAHDVLAFAVAASLSAAITSGWPAAVLFAVVFSLSRVMLGRLSARVVSSSADVNAEQVPAALLSLALAPLAALPIVLGDSLGDGGLLSGLAGLLTLLFIVREAANLATARAEAEAERQRLEQANALQDELIHLITHDLKTPVGAVLSFAQLGMRALERGNYERLRGYLENIEGASQSMRRLVESLGQLNRFEREGTLPPSTPLDVRALVQEIVDEHAPLAEQKSQQLVLEGQDVPLVLAPPVLLRESLSNLVGNAIKYTPTGGTITVWCRSGDDLATVAIGVTDTGIGISKADQARLFTRFFRSSDPRAASQRGSGLGLALSRSVIERVGGHIEVESVLGQGTTFRVLLPGVGS